MKHDQQNDMRKTSSLNLHGSSGFRSKANANSHSPDWSLLVRTQISRGSHREVLRLYTQIRTKRIYISGLVPLILKACASLSSVRFGKSLHAETVKCGTHSDVLVGTSLVDMYAKCKQIREAQKVYDSMPDRNVVTRNAMIGGFMKNGEAKSASELFESMEVRTPVTWIEMIAGLASCGDTSGARRLFDIVPSELTNLVTWTVMVDGYCINGEMDNAREVFDRMPDRNFFVWSSMIFGYCKNGEVREARSVFDEIPMRNLVNWNSMISGYVQNGFSEEAIEMFERMRIDGFDPDEVTAASVLSACASAGQLDLGREIHGMVIDRTIRSNQIVLNALVDMFSKCGDLESANMIFQEMRERNTACWNAMISGFALHGHCKEALELFASMEVSSEKPDQVTYLAALSACAHGGFVNKGLEIFSEMDKNGVEATVKHYGCLVDLLGRAGKLKEAYDLIGKMPVEPNDVVWGAMIGACRVHFDTEMIERIVREIESRNSKTGLVKNVHNVILSSIYAASDRWEEAERLRMVMVNNGFHKKPGLSLFMS